MNHDKNSESITISTKWNNLIIFGRYEHVIILFMIHNKDASLQMKLSKLNVYLGF